MTVTQDTDVRGGNDETSQLLSEQEQQWVDKFMDETTLFLGPDPAIMRHHEIMPRTEYEQECITHGINVLEIDRIRKRLAGSLDEAFEMCESMGAAPGAKWADLSVAVYTAEGDVCYLSNRGVIAFSAVLHHPIRYIMKNWKNEPTVGINPGDGFFQCRSVLRLDGGGLRRGDGAFGDQFRTKNAGGLGMGRDLAVKDGQGEGGLVGFVVTITAVAHHVDDHVALELLAEFERESGDIADGLGIVAVHVEDGRLDHLGDVGAIAAGAGFSGVGGEADLVVDDEVDGAAGAVARKLGKVEHLRDDTLAGKRGIAMQ